MTMVQLMRTRTRTVTSVMWISLSVCDIMTSISIILSHVSMVQVSTLFRISVYASILTITCLSMDKMLSIALPFSYNIYRHLSFTLNFVTTFIAGSLSSCCH